MIHGVNKSPGLASFYLRTFPPEQWLLWALCSPPCAFVGFTVTGIARKLHPIPVTPPRERRALLRRYTGYSFVAFIIKRPAARVNRYFCAAAARFLPSCHHSMKRDARKCQRVPLCVCRCVLSPRQPVAPFPSFMLSSQSRQEPFFWRLAQ